jgi:hypothetical protein
VHKLYMKTQILGTFRPAKHSVYKARPLYCRSHYNSTLLRRSFGSIASPQLSCMCGWWEPPFRFENPTHHA